MGLCNSALINKHKKKYVPTIDNTRILENRYRHKKSLIANVSTQKVYLSKHEFQELMEKNRIQQLKKEYMKMFKAKIIGNYLLII